MSTPANPSTAVAEVDRLITLAIDQGIKFPLGVKRWQLFAWAAEALEAKRLDPGNFTRTGLRELTARHFPQEP